MKKDTVREELLTKRKRVKVDKKQLLSTGYTLLDIAMTEHIEGGIVPGQYYIFIGDSDSGKTWVLIAILAEAAMNSFYDDYDLVYDGAEDGVKFDIRQFFGKKALKRIHRPGYYLREDKKETHSATIEDFYFNIERMRKRGKPFLWILDSMDALSSKQEEKVFKENMTRHEREQRTGKESKEKGSYGDGKAKKNSSGIRQVVLRACQELNSVVFIINQTRDNINSMGWGDDKTRSGGHAMIFYAAMQIWTSVVKEIRKKVNDIDRQQGVLVRIKLKRNRFTGKRRSVTMPIYHSYGIDNLGGCVDYLLLEGHWKKSKGKIKATEFDFVGTKEDLIRHIEKEDSEQELYLITLQVWKDIEEQLTIKRKPRYA